MAKVKNISTGEVREVAKPTQALADQGFVPVSAGTTPTKIAGTTTPTTAQPALPEIGDLNISKPSDKVTSSDIFSTVSDLANRQDLKTQKAEFQTGVEEQRETLLQKQQAERDAKRAEIGRQFDPVIEEITQFREDVTDSTKAQFNTNRRLSTAALSFVDSRRATVQKQIKDLESAKATALANLDTSLGDKLDKQIAEFKNDEIFWIRQEEDLKKQQFNQQLQLMSIARGEEIRTEDLALEEQDRIRNEEQNQVDFENSLQLSGFKKVRSEEELKDLTEDQITRLFNPVTGVTDIFVKPVEAGAEEGLIENFISRFPTAGITLEDDLATAQEKIRAIQTPVRGGGGGVVRATPTTVAEAQSTVAEAPLVDASGKPIKLTSTQVDAFQGFNSSLDLIDRIAPLAQNVDTGPLAGRLAQLGILTPGLSETLGFTQEEQKDVIQLEALMRNLQASFQKAISGAAVSEPEARRLAKFLPSINDNEQQLSIKLSTLKDSINTQKAGLRSLVGAVEQQTGTNVVEAEEAGEEVRVREISTGRTGTIPRSELDEAKFEIIQ